MVNIRNNYYFPITFIIRINQPGWLMECHKVFFRGSLECLKKTCWRKPRFWDYVASLTVEQRSQLLQWITGYRRIPPGWHAKIGSGWGHQNWFRMRKMVVFAAIILSRWLVFGDIPVLSYSSFHLWAMLVHVSSQECNMLIDFVCVCVFSCLVDLHWLISACESSLFWDHLSSDHVIFNMCSFCYQTSFQKKIPPKNHPLQPRSRFFLRKKTRCPKNRWFSFTGALHDVTLGQCESRSFANGTYLWTATGFVSWLTFKTRNGWNLGGKKYKNTKPGFTRLPCPRIHIWNIYLHMYGKCNCL